MHPRQVSASSISSVSSEGLRRCFEESWAAAAESAANAEQAATERRRLADEYLDVSLYLYDQLCGRLHSALGEATKAEAAGGGAGGGGSMMGAALVPAGGNIFGLDMPVLPVGEDSEQQLVDPDDPREEQQALTEVAVLCQSTLQDALAFARNAGDAGIKYGEASAALDRIGMNRQAIFAMGKAINQMK